MSYKKLLGTFIAVMVVGYGAFFVYSNAQAEYSRQRQALIERKLQDTVNQIRREVSGVFATGGEWPTIIEIDGEEYEIDYTFDDDLSGYINRLLRRHRSDYSAIVVIENDTGRVLAASGFERSNNKVNHHLAFSSTHPAASLIKIVTAAGLFEYGNVAPSKNYSFHGRGTTLYRSQVMSTRTRGLRTQSFERAFAFSNNVIFGRAAIDGIDPDDFFIMAKEFGFNRPLMSDVRLSESLFHPAEDDYNLAELASGFNRETMISPLHASLLPQVIANDGVKKYPRVIDQVRRVSNGEVVWANDEVVDRVVVSEKTAEMLKQVMEATTRYGTARGTFRRIPRSIQGKIRFGGKTGSLTGGIPHGRRDWFVSYAVPNEREVYGGGISIAVMNVNLDRWYVKSTYLAQQIVGHYFTRIQTLDELTKVSEN